jgi:hypothetical protein
MVYFIFKYRVPTFTKSYPETGIYSRTEHIFKKNVKNIFRNFGVVAQGGAVG